MKLQSIETTARAVIEGGSGQIENMTSIRDVKRKVQELKKAEVLLPTLLKACRR